jgi:hypothetical protein
MIDSGLSNSPERSGQMIELHFPVAFFHNEKWIKTAIRREISRVSQIMTYYMSLAWRFRQESALG